jgi:uncharacterized protein involved in type VI secretion and phage assembly
MSLLDLSFQSGESSLSVRRFSVHEEMSSLFSVSIWARSPNEDIDLSTIVGKPAGFRVVSGLKYALLDGGRAWTGICSHAELVQPEPTGLSTYYLRIVPKLWFLTQRTNHRIFQRASVPDIVDTVLSEWNIKPTWKIDRASYPKFEYRVQYGESDYGWISRLLEEAGISFGFVDGEKKDSELVFWDNPQHNEPRTGLPISYVDKPNEASELEYITNVRFAEVVRPGKVTVRDHDFRRQPQFKLLSDTPALGTEEDKLELYTYAPGAFKAIQAPPMKAQSAGEGGGEKKQSWFDEQKNKLVDKADEQVTKLVNDEVTELLNNALKDVAGKFAADVAGELLGGISGEIAGNVAGKIASDILRGDRDSFDIDFEKILREKMKGVVNGKIAGKVDEKVTKFVNKKLKKLGKLGDMAATAAGDLAGEAMKAAGNKALDAMLVDGKKAAEQAGAKAAKALGAGSSLAGLLTAGDDKGTVRHDEKVGKALAQRSIESVRTGKTSLTFDTNAIDLRPGVIFSMAGHTSSKISAKTKLLVTSFSLEGTPTGEWSMSGAAVFADQPYRPMMKTPKPKIEGLQSAVVVGPPGQEIHTDEFGRVRVQFHWDREGGFNDDSSRWMRVSQGWGGPGFGMISIPRVGTEVAVAYLEGNPDNPLVVGQVFSTTSPVPHKLPDNKTVTAWRGNSSPGGGGFNEILMEDMKGKEMLFMQAEKNLRKLVKNDETEITQQNRRITVGANLTKMVTYDETETTGSDRTISVGENLRESVGANHAVTVAGSHTQQVGQGLSMTMDVKERLEITVGAAKLVIDKSGKVELNGVEFDFTASGPVQINGSIIDLN